MTLIEVTVAMMLTTGAVIATVNVSDAGTRTAVAANRRAQAAALAAREVETIRSVSYARVGVSAGASGFVSTFEGSPTVRVDSSPVLPTDTIVISGTTYTVTRNITWGDVTSSTSVTVTGAYKRIIVSVTWSGPPTGTVRVDSGVSPYYQASSCTRRYVDADPGTITGVVNTYAAGTAAVAAGATTISVGTERGSTSFAAGTLVIVMEMTGANAGVYEYAMATSAVTGGQLAVTGTGASGGLLNSYSSFQIIRVPTYPNAIAAAGLTAAAWDGSTGGVLAIDVTGALQISGAVSVSGTGLTVAEPSSLTISTSRLLPGGGGTGAPGGGLLIFRTSTLTGSGSIVANGTAGSAGGDGGTVVVSTESGGVDALTAVSATGAATGGDGGAVLSSGPPQAVTLTAAAGGQTGVTNTAVMGQSLTGMALGVGCRPAVTISKATTTAAIQNTSATTASYRISLANAANRGTATAAAITDALPAGLTYLSTDAVATTGGASRTSTSNPTAAATAPQWGSFSMPGGSTVTIDFTVTVPSSVAAGVIQNSASVTYAGDSGAGAATYPSAFSTADDVTISKSSCATPYTDTASGGVLHGVLNTYYNGTASVTAGGSWIPVGTSSGASTAIAPGDLLLVIQMQDATIDYTNTSAYGKGGSSTTGNGVSALGQTGLYEYVVAATAVTSGVVRVNGGGSGGGLINGYDSVAASGTAGASTYEVIRVPTYSDVKLGSDVVALAWDGRVGGVIAVDISGTLDLNSGKADASGKGFRGGGGSIRTDTASAYNTTVVGSNGVRNGSHGEGVAGTPRYVSSTGTVVDTGVEGLPGGAFGRGAPGNAGGGGAIKGGSGGGANGGDGGAGALSPTAQNGGNGGAMVTPATARLVVGGGGGGAPLNTGQSNSSSGGAGGGIVMIRATAVTGTGTIDARGAAGGAGITTSGVETGGGGGGAGGTVVLAGPTSAAGLSVLAGGGAGGTSAATIGGGAGGGGGVAWLPSGVPSATVTGGAAASTGPSTKATAGSNGSSSTIIDTNIVGTPIGVGCRPVLILDKTTPVSSVFRIRSQQVQWTLDALNPAGRLPLSGVSLTDHLPTGMTYSATDTVTLTGSATRDSTSNPTAAATVPTWGSFSIPAGGRVRITFTVDLGTSAAGTFSNNYGLVGTYSGGSISATFSGTDTTTDDAVLADFTNPGIISSKVYDSLGGCCASYVDKLTKEDATTYTAAAGWTTTADTTRYIDVVQDLVAFPISSTVIQGASLSARLKFAGSTGNEVTCVYLSVVQQSTGTVLSTVGSGSAAAACVTGNVQTAFTIAVPGVTMTGNNLNDLTLRIFGWSDRSKKVVVDRAGLEAVIGGATVPLPIDYYVDKSAGGAGTTVKNPLAYSTTNTTDLGGPGRVPAAFDTAQYLEFTFLPMVPTSGVTIGSASASFEFKSLNVGQVCWYGEVRSGGSVIGNIASSGSPICHATAATASPDTVSLGSMTAAQANDITVRMYFNGNSSSITYLRWDKATMALTWSQT